MSDNTTDKTDGQVVPAPGDDPRRVWVTPTIEELPISETQAATVIGTGPDVGVYT